MGGGRNLGSAPAFTLAEVLVTLGIIGVISAMTVPSLMQNHQKKTYVTQLHKVYNELQQASLQYMTDRNAVNLTEAGLTSLTSVSDFIKTYFKVIQDCGQEQTPCFAEAYKNLSGDASGFSCANGCMVLAGGASIGFTSLNPYPNTIIQFSVDINGAKGPNIFGRYAFALALYKNGVIDDHTSDGDGTVPLTTEQREQAFREACINDTKWHGCFGKILNDNWEMTY